MKELPPKDTHVKGAPAAPSSRLPDTLRSRRGDSTPNIPEKLADSYPAKEIVNVAAPDAVYEKETIKATKDTQVVVYRAESTSEHDAAHKEVNKKAKYEFHEYLATVNKYPEEHPLTTYVQERLDVISEGKKARVTVVHEDAPNAFALPGEVVVSDTMLQILDHQEELDALLGHEWTHLGDDHVHQSSTNADMRSKIGQRRKHEVEADFKPIEHLDKLGINPAGMVSMLGKLEQWAIDNIPDENRRKQFDVDHGTLLDRRLNLDTAAWVVDIRNLSTEFTPIGVTAEDFGGYERDEDLRERFAELEPTEKRHLLERELKNFGKEKFLNHEERKAKGAQIMNWQKEIIHAVAPDVTAADLNALSRIALLNGYSAQDEAVQVMYDTEGSIDRWLAHNVKTYDNLKHFYDLHEHEAFDELGIDPRRDYVTAKEVANTVLGNVLEHQENIDPTEYVQAIKDSGVASRLGASFFADSNSLYYLPLITELERRGALDALDVNAFAVALVDTPVRESKVYSGEKSSNDERLGLIQVPEKQIVAINATFKAVEKIRLQHLNTLADPIEIAEYIANNIHDVTSPYLTWKNLKPEVQMAGSKIKKEYTIRRIVEMIGQRESDDGKPMSRESKLLLQGVYTERINFDDNEFEAIKYARRRGDTVDTKPREIQNLSLLHAACLPKNEYLAAVKIDIDNVLNGLVNSTMIRTMTDNILSAPERARSAGVHVDWEMVPNDLIKGADELVTRAYSGYVKEALRNDSTHETVVEILQKLPVHRIPEDSWNKLATKVVKDGISVDNPSHMEAVMTLGLISENTRINLEVPTRAAEAVVQQLDFDEGMQFIFEKYAHLPRHVFSSALEHLIEHKATTPEQFDRIEAAITSDVKGFFDNDQRLGDAAIIDTFLLDPSKTLKERTDRIGIRTYETHGMQPGELFDAMLQSGSSDKALKEYLLDRWWMMQRRGQGIREVSEFFDFESPFLTHRHPGKEARLDYWAKEVPEKYLTLSAVVQDVYLANDAMKYAALRKVLTGDGGVLATEEGKQAFADTFLKDKVDLADGTDGSMTKSLVDSLVSVGREDELYHHLSPVLRDMVLQLPEQAYPYAELAADMADKKLEQMKERGLIPEIKPNDKAALTKKFYSLMLAGKKPETATALAPAASNILSLFPDEQTSQTSPKLSPWELGLSIGEKSGAVGTRMLQIVGQTFPVPEEYTDRVLNSYDNAPGQSRLQAYRVLRREAETSPEIAALLEDVAEIGPRIGGGSLMSVYDFHMRDGSREAVAVKNANVEYNLGKTVDLAIRTIDEAQQRDPENKDYQMLGVLLADVQEWVNRELHDPAFPTKDAAFREKYDSRFTSDNADRGYKILVPDAKPTGTEWVRRDTFIEGKNLTSLAVVEDGQTDIEAGVITQSDYKEAVSVMTTNALQQLGDGLVHSDVHPGNFRITNDNTAIAVFDRYNLMELSEKDKALIGDLVGAYSEGNMGTVRERFVDYLMELDINDHLQNESDSVKSALEQAEVSDSFEGALMDSILTLKQQGVRVPLEISLIGKNLQALTGLAHQAGFSGIIEAAMYKAV